MLILRGFTDPDAPVWLVWTTMLTTLATLHFLLIWTILAVIALCQEPLAHVREACPGSPLWWLLVVLTAFTAALSACVLRVLSAAQTGLPLPGSRWPARRKRSAVHLVGALWLAVWIAAGASSLSSCALDRLAGDTVRRMVVTWFWWHTTIVLLVTLVVASDAAYLWWRRRQVRAARAAYCSTQVGAGTSGAGEKVII